MGGILASAEKKNSAGGDVPGKKKKSGWLCGGGSGLDTGKRIGGIQVRKIYILCVKY